MYLGTQNVLLQQVECRSYGIGQHEQHASTHYASVSNIVLPLVHDLNDIFLCAQSRGSLSILGQPFGV
jgi:hypothetical protein